MKRVTIKDIANYCGVSITTVSLVLNGKTDEIGDTTIKKVEEGAKKLGYSRNEVARSLVTNRSKTIAFIIPDITNLFYSTIIKSANKIAVENGYNILLCNTNNSFEEELAQINLLDNRLIDGVIIASRNAKKLLKNFENSRSVPIVVIDEDIVLQNENTIVVTTDNKEAGFTIANYLLDYNHKNIFLLGGLKDSTNTINRYKGVMEAIKSKDISKNNIEMKYANYQMQKAYEVTLRYFEEKYTAILAFNDLMAYGAIKAINELEIENVSVAAFDATATSALISNITEYDLTSINQDEKMIGKIAFEKILEKLDGNGNDGNQNKYIHIPANLHIGDTVDKN